MKNPVENYPFITKILQKIIKIFSFIQHFFSKSNTKNLKTKNSQKLLTNVANMVYNRYTCYFVTIFQDGIDI